MKTYIIDTNVLMEDLNILEKFQNAKVVLPLTIFKELNKLKTSKEEQKKKKAIRLSHYFDNLNNKGLSKRGIKNKHNAFIITENLHEECLPKGLDISDPDNEVLSVALYFKQKGENVVLMTIDTSFSNIISVATKAEITVQKLKDFLVLLDTEKFDEYKARPRHINSETKHINKVFISGVCYYIADTFHLNANSVRIVLLIWLIVSSIISWWLLIFTIVIYFFLLWIFTENGCI